MGIDARTPIPTVSGWKPARAITAGDEVFSFDGEPTKVVSTQLYTPAECFKIWFEDGLTLVVDARTGIPVIPNMKIRTLGEWTRKRRRISDYAIEPLGPRLLMEKPNERHLLPNCHPLKMPKRNLPVDPFVFGQWYNDRGAKRRRERVDITRELIERYPMIPTDIPEEYLFASFEQRLALLRGILSQRKNCFDPKYGDFKFATRSLKMLRQVQNLVESLGLRSRIEFGTWNTLKFRSQLRLIEEQTPHRAMARHDCRVITRIEKTEPRECVYIKSEDTLVVSEGFLTICL